MFLVTHKINPTNSVFNFQVTKKCQENVITLVYTRLQNVNILNGHSYTTNYAATKLYYRATHRETEREKGCSYCSTNLLPHIMLVDEIIEDTKTIHPKTGKKVPNTKSDMKVAGGHTSEFLL